MTSSKTVGITSTFILTTTKHVMTTSKAVWATSAVVINTDCRQKKTTDQDPPNIAPTRLIMTGGTGETAPLLVDLVIGAALPMGQGGIEAGTVVIHVSAASGDGRVSS